LGTAMAPDASLDLRLDPNLAFNWASQSSADLGNGVYRFALGNVPPGAEGNFYAVCKYACTLKPGDSVIITADILPDDTCVVAGGSPAGAPVFEFSTRRPVFGSYDPNDKTAEPVGTGDDHFIPADTTLHYLIRFQNTGNDTAFNIVVRD